MSNTSSPSKVWQVLIAIVMLLTWHSRMDWGHRRYQFFECFSGKGRVSKKMQLPAITTLSFHAVVGSGLGPGLKPQHPRHSYGYRVASFDMAYSEDCLNFLEPAGFLCHD